MVASAGDTARNASSSLIERLSTPDSIRPARAECSREKVDEPSRRERMDRREKETRGTAHYFM